MIGVSDDEEREKGAEGLFEQIIAENFPNLGKETSIQTQEIEGEALYKKVLRTSLNWKNSQQLMYVVGATKAEYLKEIRQIVPNHFLLVPGVGAQGGSLEEVCRYGLNDQYGLLINSSRGIIYASKGEDFATVAAEKAQELQEEMKKLITNIC